MKLRNIRRPRVVAEPGPRRGRLLFLSIVLGIGVVTILARAFHLQVSRNEEWLERGRGQHETQVKLPARRGDIFDRNGRALAISANVPSVFAVPREVLDPEGTTARLVELLGVEPSKILPRLQKKNEFAWIARQITPVVADRLMTEALPGIHLVDESRRFYPNRTIAGALIGFAGVDGAGLEGLERDYDRHLRGKEYTFGIMRDARGRELLTGGFLPEVQLAGSSIVSTIDLRIQQVAEAALARQVEEMGARAGFVVVMEPRSGDVLAMAQTPPFDPNLFQEARAEEWRNQPVTDSLEPGSTIKPFLVAAALDAGKVTPESTFDGHGGAMQFGKKLIRDVHGVGRMTTYEVVKFSSNIGAVQVGQRLGKELYSSYLQAYGFGEPTGVGLAGEQSGILHPVSKWGQIHLATMSYGYGLSVTPLQMCRAMAVFANGGRLMRPRIVKSVQNVRGQLLEEFPPREVRRVISEQAARQIGEALWMVTQKGGTGGRAVVPGYRVGGKTGTAHKVDPVVRGYSKNKVRSSFVGMVPVDDPKLVMYVLVDEPTKAEYGGVVAAPIFRMIGQEVLPYLGVPPTEPIVAAAGSEDEAEVLGESDQAEVFETVEARAQAWWLNDAAVDAPRTTMPDLRGATVGEALAELRPIGADPRIEGAGLVVSQRPLAGARLEAGESVSLTLALPGEPVRLAEAAREARDGRAAEAAEGGAPVEADTP